MIKSDKIIGKPKSISIFLIKKYSFIRFSFKHDVIVSGWFHRMFLEEIFRKDPLAQLSTFSFVFKLLQYFEKVLRKCPRGKLSPALILTLILYQTLTLIGGQFSSEAIFRTPFENTQLIFALL